MNVCTKLKPVFVLLGNDIDNETVTDEGFEHIILLTKYFIYKCKINKIKPRLDYFLDEFKRTLTVEKYMYCTAMNNDKYILKWGAYFVLVE